MKRFLYILILLNSYLAFSQDIPEKLLLSSKAFSENQSLYPIYRIDLIIFSHKQVNEKDKQEQFPELDSFIYSPDLLKLLDTPNLLVKKEAIEEGLVPSSQVIQSVDLSQKLNPFEVEEVESIDNDINSDVTLLPYEYFELIKNNSLNKRFISRLINILLRPLSFINSKYSYGNKVTSKSLVLSELFSSSILIGLDFWLKSIDCMTCELGTSPSSMASFFTKRFGVSKSFNKS